jgi:Protein of unknown function (DUF1493)
MITVSESQFSAAVQEFIDWKRWTDKKFDLDAFIELDLGLSGDDMDNFVLWYADKYQMRLDGFEWRNHYGAESARLSDIFVRFPYELCIGYSLDYLTFRDFFEAIPYGVWDKWLVTRNSRRGKTGTSIISRLLKRVTRSTN